MWWILLKKNNNGTAYHLFIVLIIGLVMRLVLTTVFNQPFSTDVWPLIKISERLLENPHVKIFDDRFFDGYNNRWPGVVLSTSVASAVMGLDIYTVYRYLYPIIVITAFSTLLYLLLKTHTRDSGAASIGLLYFLSIPSFIVFSSALLKEVYAYPFLFILLFYALKKRCKLGRDALLLLIVSMGLVMTHFFVTLMAIGILGSTLLAYIIGRMMKGIRSSENGVVSRAMIIITMLSLVFATYYSLFGYPSLKMVFTVKDVLIYISYNVFVFGTYILQHRRGAGNVLKIVALTIVLTLLLLATVYDAPLLPGVEVESSVIPYYIVPVILPLVFFAWLSERDWENVFLLKYLLCGVVLFTTVNVLFIVFSKPELSTIFHRMVAYLILANTVLVTTASNGVEKWVRKASVAASIIAVLFSCIVLVNIIGGVDDLVFTWSYRVGEVHGFSYALEYSDGEEVLCGDVKFSYYASIERSIDTACVLKAMYTGYNIGNKSVIVLYIDNYLKGYMVGLNVYRINEFIEKSMDMQRVFDNGYVFLFK